MSLVAAIVLAYASIARTPASADPVAGVVNPKPPIESRHRKSFIPALGNWEGTENGLPASFDLRFDPSLRDRSGVPKYGIAQLVALRPAGCPATRSSYRETLVTGHTPVEIARYGSLGLANFGFNGSFKGSASATLSESYRNASCGGVQTWHMHPVHRAPVDDGGWRLTFRDGETSSFSIMADGRLATAIQLPHSLTACNGVRGVLDAFIAADGRARVLQADVRISVRFSRKTATGELDSGGRGCAHGPFRFRAAVK